MGKQRDDKKRLEKATALLALAAQSVDAEELQTDCPAAEELAAYSEGMGTERELSTFFAHLEECDSCYSLWLMVNEEKIRRDHSSAPSRLKKYSYIGSAFALAASVVVFLNIKEPLPVLMQIDENEVGKDITIMGTGSQPALPEAEEQQVKPVAEPLLRADIDAGKIPDVQVSEEEMIAAPQTDKSIIKFKRAKDIDFTPQNTLPSKAAGVQKSLQEMSPRQEAATAVENDSISGFNRWVDQLREGCLTGQQDSRFWKSLAEKGEIMYKEGTQLLSTSELSLLRKLIMQVNQMGESYISSQCVQVLQILAEEDESR